MNTEVKDTRRSYREIKFLREAWEIFLNPEEKISYDFNDEQIRIIFSDLEKFHFPGFNRQDNSENKTPNCEELKKEFRALIASLNFAKKQKEKFKDLVLRLLSINSSPLFELDPLLNTDYLRLSQFLIGYNITFEKKAMAMDVKKEGNNITISYKSVEDLTASKNSGKENKTETGDIIYETEIQFNYLTEEVNIKRSDISFVSNDVELSKYVNEIFVEAEKKDLREELVNTFLSYEKGSLEEFFWTIGIRKPHIKLLSDKLRDCYNGLLRQKDFFKKFMEHSDIKNCDEILRESDQYLCAKSSNVDGQEEPDKKFVGLFIQLVVDEKQKDKETDFIESLQQLAESYNSEEDYYEILEEHLKNKIDEVMGVAKHSSETIKVLMKNFFKKEKKIILYREM